MIKVQMSIMNGNAGLAIGARYAITRFMIYAVVVFVLMAIIFKMVGYKEYIPRYMELVRALFIVYGFVVALCVSIHVKLRVQLIIHCILVFSLSAVIRLAYSLHGLDIFGPSYDSYAYLHVAERFSTYGWGEYLDAVGRLGYNRDDLGFFSLTYLFARVYNSEVFIAYGMLVLNVVLLYFSSYYLYRLAKLLDIEEWIARLVAVIWCTFPFLTMTMASGLKEVVFCSLIVLAVYNMYRYKERKRMKSLIGVVFFVVSCLFFRTAIFYLLVFTFILVLWANERNGKKLLALGLVACAAMSFILPYLLSMMGYAMESVTATADARMSSRGASSTVTGVLPYIAAVLGPFPNMNRTDSYGFMHGYAIFLKCCMSGFFVVGVFRVIKRVDVKWFPLLLFIIGNLLMLIVSGVTLDMRYHITYIPFFFLLACSNCYGKGSSLYGMYLLCLLFVIWKYNSRSLAVG